MRGNFYFLLRPDFPRDPKNGPDPEDYSELAEEAVCRYERYLGQGDGIREAAVAYRGKEAQMGADWIEIIKVEGRTLEERHLSAMRAAACDLRLHGVSGLSLGSESEAMKEFGYRTLRELERDLLSYIPAELAELYEVAAGSSAEDPERARKSRGFELMLTGIVNPFAMRLSSPHDWRCFDLRDCYDPNIKEGEDAIVTLRLHL